MVLGLKPMGKLDTSKKTLSTRQNQGFAQSSDSNLQGNQIIPKNSKYQTEPRSYMVLGPKSMGKLDTSKKTLSTRQNQGLAQSSDSNLQGNQILPKNSKYQTKPRSCMVLGLKPMGKLDTSKKTLSTRQNQGLAWSSDSNLWGENQILPKNSKYQTEPRSCMVLGLKPMGGKLDTSKKL